MKTLTIYALLGMGTLAYAGGNISPVKEISIPVNLEESPIEESSGGKNFYIGQAANLVSMRTSDASVNYFDAADGQKRVGNATLLAGYNIYKKLAVEVRAMGSVAYDSHTQFRAVSLFVKPQYEIMESGFSIHALVGYGTGVATGNTAKVDEAGFQWGLGASYEMTSTASLFAEYTSFANEMEGTFMDDTKLTVDALTVGVIYKF